MRNLYMVPILLMGLALAGCVTLDPSGVSVLKGGNSITAPVANPVNNNTLADVEAADGVAVALVVGYGNIGICPRGTVETLAKPCARLALIQSFRAYQNKAYAAIVAARKFARENPTVSPVASISAARKAVADFQAELDRNKAVMAAAGVH